MFVYLNVVGIVVLNYDIYYVFIDWVRGCIVFDFVWLFDWMVG